MGLSMEQKISSESLIRTSGRKRLDWVIVLSLQLLKYR